MSYVVTLARYTPLERDDSIPWTQALIEEAAAAAGPWTTIDTITLSPVDTDPANPIIRDLTTRQATIPEGFYRVQWRDGTGAISAPTSAVQNTSDFPVGIRPTVTEVATLVRSRTKDTGGKELGTFTASTRPNSDMVETLIDFAIDEVEGKVQPIDASQPVWAKPGDAYNAPGSPYETRIRGAVALYTAILVETSLFQEQVKSGQSPASIYQQLFDSRIRALISEGETGQAQGMGEGASGAGDAPADAAWGGFPAFGPGAAVGWNSRW